MVRIEKKNVAFRIMSLLEIVTSIHLLLAIVCDRCEIKWSIKIDIPVMNL